MIKSIHALTKEPFGRTGLTLLRQQKEIYDIIKIHSQQGGFSVIIGEPGVGKSVLRDHIESLEKERDITVVSCSRTMHTYWQILTQLADSFKIEVPEKSLEKELIACAYNHIKERKTLYILIDEAHLLEMHVLRTIAIIV
jgi:MSHA biogenesis protein MshM